MRRRNGRLAVTNCVTTEVVGKQLWQARKVVREDSRKKKSGEQNNAEIARRNEG